MSTVDLLKAIQSLSVLVCSLIESTAGTAYLSCDSANQWLVAAYVSTGAVVLLNV